MQGLVCEADGRHLLMDTDTGYVQIRCQWCHSTSNVKVMRGWMLLCRACRKEQADEWTEDDPDFG